MKLNLGCASRILEGYINIDLDSIEQIRARYPNINIPQSATFVQGNIFSLDYPNSSVDEIRADALVEHLDFKEEPIFFKEVYRLLKPGGVFLFETPDFEWTVKTWLSAADDWREFFRDDPEAIGQQHWFGTYSYSFDNRWGYLMASIFGPQNGAGQYHKNAYTEQKVRAVCRFVGFDEPLVSRYRWKGDRDLMLKVAAQKPLQ